MQTVEEIVGAEALSEWLEHPVTGWLAGVIEERATEAVTNRANVFYPGEPNRTQELISRLNGAVDELNLLYGVLNEHREEGQEDPLNYLSPETEDE